MPERLRVLGLFDLTLLWGNLSVSLLVIVAAAGLVPMLSLPQALIAILIGAVAGNVLLGLAGAIGADARVPGMVLLRAPLGRRGSYAPTVLNVAQNLGWSTFELIIISTAAAALSERVFGFRERWLWALLFGAISLVLGLLGPIGFVRRYLKKFAAWAVAASIVYLTWWVLDKANLHALWHQHGHGRGHARPGDRPRDRQHHLLDAARRRLHALRARPAQRLLRRRGRLLRADDLVLRDRLAARALARPERADADPERGRERQRARGSRAADADRRRERRGLRRRLLDGGLAAEPDAAPRRSGC